MALMCTEQHQVCSANDPSKSTPLAGQSHLYNESVALSAKVFSEKQLAIITRLAFALVPTSIYTSVAILGDAALLASRTIFGGSQTAQLPMDQWQIEVRNWLAVSLAQLQSAMLLCASGPGDPAQRSYVAHATSHVFLEQCQNQRIAAAPGHVNFDFAVVLVVFLVGVVLIPLGLIFDKIVENVSFGTKRKARHRAWVDDGLFQLHRVTLQETRGVKGWEYHEKTVPQSLDMVLPTADEVHGTGLNSSSGSQETIP